MIEEIKRELKIARRALKRAETLLQDKVAADEITLLWRETSPKAKRVLAAELLPEIQNIVSKGKS